MEFLVSPSNAQAKIVLALLISSNEATHLHLYSWEEKRPLRFAKLESCGPHKLSHGDRMPLLMIPSNHNASFTLVTESGLTVYDDVLSPEIRRINIEVPQTFPPTFLGSCRSPLWVQWAKPCRHSEYLKTNDDFFLVREDGELDYFEIVHNMPSRVQSRGDIGSLNIGVDSAFAILEGPLDQGGDICIVGGDMTDGTVCHMMARLPVERFQTITNLAPLRDLLILDRESRDEIAQHMFVCSGKGDGHAAVAEIRSGLEARVGFIAEHEDSSAATGIWALPETISDHLTFLVSYPLHTTILRINFENSTLENADAGLTNMGLQLNSQTLALGVIGESFLVQITSSAVTLMSALSKINSVHRKHANHPVLTASIHPDAMLIVTVAMVNEMFQVLLSSIDINDASITINDYSRAYSLAEEPSSTLVFDHGEMQLLIIGTVVGSIYILTVDSHQEIRLLSRSSVTTLFPDVETSAVCSLSILVESSLGPPALACGTRNGWIMVLTIVSDLPAVETESREPTNAMQDRPSDPLKALTLQPESAQRIGQTSVQLMSISENQSAALLFCDFQLHRISYARSDWAVTFQFRRVWFTDVAQVCLRQ